MCSSTDTCETKLVLHFDAVHWLVAACTNEQIYEWIGNWWKGLDNV